MQGKHHLEIGKPKNRPALCSQKYQTYILSIFALTQRTGLYFIFYETYGNPLLSDTFVISAAAPSGVFQIAEFKLDHKHCTHHQRHANDQAQRTLDEAGENVGDKRYHCCHNGIRQLGGYMVYMIALGACGRHDGSIGSPRYTHFPDDISKHQTEAHLQRPQ